MVKFSRFSIYLDFHLSTIFFRINAFPSKNIRKYHTKVAREGGKIEKNFLHIIAITPEISDVILLFLLSKQQKL